MREVTAEDVRLQLLERIASGDLQPGRRLGTERDLAAGFGVSRTLLRQALESLERDGAIRRVRGPGGGTFVSQGKVVRTLSTIIGVPALLRQQGVTVGTQLISSALVSADHATASALMGEPGDLVVELVWIRLANGVPISLENARLPADRFPGLLDMPLSGSVHEFLDARFGVIPAESVERMSVVAATEEEATILETEPQAPLLSISRVTKDSAAVPIEFSQDLFRADRTVLVVRSVGYGSGQNPVTLQGSIQLSAQAGIGSRRRQDGRMATAQPVRSAGEGTAR